MIHQDEVIIVTDKWPEGVSDGLTLPCVDCHKIPEFDYIVLEEFWRKWVKGPQKTSVVCLPCLDIRCDGVGLAESLMEVQWTGTGHTVVLKPEKRYEY